MEVNISGQNSSDKQFTTHDTHDTSRINMELGLITVRLHYHSLMRLKVLNLFQNVATTSNILSLIKRVGVTCTS